MGFAADVFELVSSAWSLSVQSCLQAFAQE